MVRQVELLSRIVAAESTVNRFLRKLVLPTAIKIAAVRTRMVTTITGLDLELPRFTHASASRAAVSQAEFGNERTKAGTRTICASSLEHPGNGP